MTAAPASTDALAAERARELQVYSYLPRGLDLTDHRPSLEDGLASMPVRDHKPQPSKDPALCAFAQLGAHRLKTSRVFISLIDSQSQFILTEATKTIPLGNMTGDAPHDPLWLGSAIIPRTSGVGQSALHTDSLVVSDLQQDDRFPRLPFAGASDHSRFYAGVPLKTPQGWPIGVYSAIDESPRPEGLEERDLLFMQDVAATVVSYLCAARAHDTNRKAEQMVRGLSSFVTGAADLQARNDLDVPRDPASTSPPRSQSPRRESQDEALHASEDAEEHQDQPPVPADDEGYDDLLSPGTKRMFSRAAHIMRQASELDGVIFFDASVANSSASEEDPPSPATDESGNELSRSEVVSPESATSTTSSYSKVRQPTCRILGFADASRSSQHGGAARANYLGLSEGSLRRLLKRHPGGKIFNIDTHAADGRPMKQTTKGALRPSSAVDAIVDVARHARSAAIIPLWDYERQRWFAGCLCWTSSPARQLAYGSDLLYLRAFGNSIMAELGRIDAMAMENVKTSFVESMSHELRSPLHGILGGVEYLLEMRLDAFQTSIVNSISMCGRTLLDTVQNLLEYSKINELASPHANPSLSKYLRISRTSAKSEPIGPPTNVRRLTEETVEAMFSGQSYNLSSSSQHKEDGDSFGSEPSTSLSGDLHSSRKVLRVILDLPYRPSWTFALQPGIWRRIVMNIFGNALRFTNAGFVRVSLSATDLDDCRSKIILTVADSGPGMSSKYIKDGLFKAFSQENSFSAGTGLGMTIVQRLVHSVGGDMSVQSKVGEGTVVEVHMVLSRCEELIDPFASAVAERTRGMHVAVAKTAVPEGDAAHRLSGETELQFHATLTDALSSWFGINVTALDDVSADSSELVMYLGPSFNTMFKSRRRQGVSMVVAMDGLEAATLRTDSRVTGGRIDVVTQPCGPLKLARVLDKYLSQLDAKSEAPLREDVISSPIVRLPPSGKPSSDGGIENIEKPAPDPAVDDTNHPPPLQAFERPDRSTTDATSTSRTSPSPPSHKTRQRSSNADRLPSSPEILASGAAASSNDDRQEILIVDDNALNIRLLSVFLRKAGFTRHTSASNGLEAVNLFKENPERWGVVLMDLSMPIMDGIAATKEIRAWERIMASNKRKDSVSGDPLIQHSESSQPGHPIPLLKQAESADSVETVREWTHDVANQTEQDDNEPPSTPSVAENRSAQPEAHGLEVDPSSGPEEPGPGDDAATCERTESESRSSASPEPAPPPPPLTDRTVERRPSAPASTRGSVGEKAVDKDGGGSNEEQVDIIVITGLGSATARFEATLAGADAFMTKPVRFAELMKTLKGRMETQKSGQDTDE